MIFMVFQKALYLIKIIGENRKRKGFVPKDEITKSHALEIVVG